MLNILLDKAVWLTDRKKNALKIAHKWGSVRELSHAELNKLVHVLCSIQYAELTCPTRFVEKLLLKTPMHSFLCSTLGIWNMSTCHATLFGFQKSVFKKLLQDDESSTKLVVRYLVDHIGLQKKPEHIMAEYNLNQMAPHVAALQKCLNFLSGPSIEEDGLIGPQTLKKLRVLSQKLPDFLIPEWIDEPMIDKTLAFCAKKYGHQVEPFIPHVKVKRGLPYAINLLKKCIRNPLELRKFPHTFKNNIDVPKYVAWGMKAFNHLNETTAKPFNNPSC